MIAAAILATLALQAEPQKPFRITVVDAVTGRGVPLVELETTNHLLFVTDNAGVVAFAEPGLLGQRVFFSVRSHGYRFAKDGFGFTGVALDTRPGGSARLEMERVQIAERLYRVTGAGPWRDSVLLGDPAPVRRPLLNGRVAGQDSVQAIPWRGRLRWIWGDTSRPAYPLGNFAGSGAVSLLPEDGGLDPSIGVDLDYFVNEQGFSRPMCPIEGPGPVWLDGLMILPAEDGGEVLTAHYVRVKSLGEILERGIALYDEDADRFRPVLQLELDAPLHPAGHPLRVRDDGEDWYLFPGAMPSARVRAELRAVLDPDAYQGFTCLEPGAEWDPEHPRIERDAKGRVVWGWKAATAFVDQARQQELVRRGHLDPAETFLQVQDPGTGRAIHVHHGSVHWNRWRRRFIAIFCEAGGESSYLGETWYAEADTPLGPWLYARKVVTHDHYSFYNPMHHPWFDQENGRRIYFEGTYTHTFSAAKAPTPRYDYNQVMYRLDLDDPRLVLPEPVYRLRDGNLRLRAAQDTPGEVAAIPFFAVAPERAVPGLVPVPNPSGSGILCLGLPPDAEASPTTMPWRDPGTGEVIALVWRNPSRVLVFGGGRPAAGW